MTHTKTLSLFILLAAIQLLAACASLSPEQHKQLAGFDSDITVAGIPFFPQQRDLCGPAALASMLGKSGSHIDPLWLERQVYLPKRHGSLSQEMLAAARSYGRLDYQIAPRLDAVLNQLKAGHAVLVLQNLGLSWYPRWHYAVVSGYRPKSGNIVIRTGWDEPTEVDVVRFAKTWQRGGSWAALILAPGDFPADAEPLKYLQSLLRFQLAMPGRKPVSDAYRLAIQHWPDYPPLRLAQANWLQQLEQLEAAEEALKQLLAMTPNYAPANNNLALLLLQKGQAKDALEYSNRALQHAEPQLRQHYEDTQQRIEAALRQ